MSNITEDVASLTTFLAAKAAPWSEYAGTYDLSFGHAVPTSNAHRLKRSIWKDTESAVEGISNVAEREYDHKFNPVRFDIGAGTQDQRSTIYSDVK